MFCDTSLSSWELSNQWQPEGWSVGNADTTLDVVLDAWWRELLAMRVEAEKPARDAQFLP
jgi:hypothetical protein